MAVKGEDAARDAGRFVGALLDCDAGMCPWLQHRHPDLRRAWLTGFSEGRIARIRLAERDLPALNLLRTWFKGSH